MPLVFENDIHFDAATDDATIWGNDGNKRFRLVIRPETLIDKYGLEKRFDRVNAKAIIQRYRADFETSGADCARGWTI
jgi:hypothetical protein